MARKHPQLMPCCPSSLCLSPGGNVYVDAPRPGRIYLPGSFNPLHDGHKEMLLVGWPANGSVLITT